MDYWSDFGNPLDYVRKPYIPNSRFVVPQDNLREDYTLEEAARMIRAKLPLHSLGWLSIPRVAAEDLRILIVALSEENIVHVYNGKCIKLPFKPTTILDSREYRIYSDRIQYVVVSKTFSEPSRRFDSLRDLLWVVPDATEISGLHISY
jgi:hypothetical protein